MSLREMVDRKNIYIIIIVASTLFITYLHHWIFQEDPRRIVLNELYYVPLLLGAMMFGLKGAILTYLLVSALYLPYLSEYWTVNFLGLMARLLHLLLSGAFAFLAGFLVDREKRRQKQFEKDLAQRLKYLSLKIYKKAQDFAEQRGILIADTKMEFGIKDGKLFLIDELLTPDSSRFWPKKEYLPGGSQKSFDKQFLRDYLLSIQWDKTPPAPELPEEVIQKTRQKYLEAYVRLVGKSL